MEVIQNQNVWRPNGNDYWLQEKQQNLQIDLLPPGVYNLENHPMMGLYLHRLYDKFEFPYKIYGLETKFVDWVVKSYDSTNKNLGILLNGLKGTGKTVTSEILANRFGLPVILINKPYDGLSNFVNGIQQDIVLLFDEFEKTFNSNDYNDDEEIGKVGGDTSILTLMDGVLSGSHRKIFILTTNSTRINENMLGRPGRVRYLKTFDNLSSEVVLEIINDKLIDKNFQTQIIDFISKLEIITIDIVKAIIEEVNIHNSIPDDFKEFFNVQYSDELCNVFQIKKGKKPEIQFGEVTCEPKFFSKSDEGESLIINGARYFSIREVIDYQTISVWTDRYDKVGERISETWKIERIQPRHKSFRNWAF